MDTMRQCLFNLYQFDANFSKNLVGQSHDRFDIASMRTKMFGTKQINKVNTRYRCVGHHMRHLGQYKKKFIAMQAGD